MTDNMENKIENENNMKKKILVVDDEEPLRDLYSRVITYLGYTVETAENGEEALEKIHSNKFVPDLIILDITMPKMNGLELATRIKKDEKYNNIKLIINSSVYENYINAFSDIGISKENIYTKLNDVNLIKEVVKNAFSNSQ
jgi:CheY-like chemotaxis protein